MTWFSPNSQAPPHQESRVESIEDVGTTDLDSLYQTDEMHSRQDDQTATPLRNMSTKAHWSIDSAECTPGHPQPLGKPTKKQRLPLKDAATAVISLISCIAAVLVVSNETLSWKLGASGANHQLIVIGVLLSIMSLCLGSVAPTLFLVLEARFGASFLQNYDGIIRNQPLASSLSFVWRLIMGMMIILPIGLSVAYKTFSGGESAVRVSPTNYISNSTYEYGMFPPQGLESLGMRTGISLMLNATIPFLEKASLLWNDTEPAAPLYPSVYGFNILSISTGSTAMLDIPEPDYITAVQDLLSVGESWSVTAMTIGTVATLNQSESVFKEACKGTVTSSSSSGSTTWTYTTTYLYNGWAVGLLNKNGLDNSAQYIGVAPVDTSCSNFYPYSHMYDIQRHACQGTWSVTRAGIQLMNGSCSAEPLPADKQEVVVNSDLALTNWYLPSMNEMLGQFNNGDGQNHRGNASVWFGPSTATCVAAMVWSRITTLTLNKQIDLQASVLSTSNGTSLTFADAGIAYPPVEETVYYIRPTLQKKSLLYLVFAIQPILVVIVLLVKIMLHKTPVDSGFGLVSILSGMDYQSHGDLLDGSTLSGQLKKPIKLTINPVSRGSDQEGVIEYTLATSSRSTGNGKLIPSLKYY